MKIPLKAQNALSRHQEAHAALISFRKKNSKVLNDYERVAAAYNESINEMKAVYKDNADTIGKRYDVFSAIDRKNIDAETLLKLMGPAADGLISIKYAVDRKEYDKAVEAGLVPVSVIDEVESFLAPAIRGPKTVGIYGG